MMEMEEGERAQNVALVLHNSVTDRFYQTFAPFRVSPMRFRATAKI